jgi:hypothetical protein
VRLSVGSVVGLVAGLDLACTCRFGPGGINEGLRATLSLTQGEAAITCRAMPLTVAYGQGGYIEKFLVK